MAEIDPITQDALKRAAQLKSRGSRQSRKTPPRPRQEKPPESPEPSEPPRSEPEKPHHKPPSLSGLNVLFRDKEQGIILLLIILLMDENCEPSLLLALMYLLI